jgi:hypothetical protein
MKTIEQLTTSKECENSGIYSFSLPSSLAERSSQKRILTPKNSGQKIFKSLKLRTRLSALTGQVAAIGLKTNARIIIGVGLVLWLAPVADTFYTYMDKSDMVPKDVWYYRSYFYLFLCLGPYIKTVIITIGLYFLFIPNETKKSYLLIAPLAPTIGKILWLIQVTNNEEYHSVLPWMFILYGAFTALFVMLIINYLTWRHNHRKLAHIKRMNGLCQIADKSDPIQKGFVTTWAELNLNNY